MDPSFHSRKQLAWGTLLFMTGLLSSLLAGVICFIGWCYCKCSDEQRPGLVIVLCWMFVLVPIQFLIRRKLEAIGVQKIQSWAKPYEKRPFLPFLTIGLWGFVIVLLTSPVDCWFRCAFVLLIYMPICMGLLLKTVSRMQDSKGMRRHPVEDTPEYRSMKSTIDALPDWLFAKDMLRKSLLVRHIDGTTSCIVDADHPVPTTIHKEYSIDSGDKQEARFELYWLENYSRTLVAEYVISNLPTAANGKSKFEVTFKIASNKQLTCNVAKPLKIEGKRIETE